MLIMRLKNEEEEEEERKKETEGDSHVEGQGSDLKQMSNFVHMMECLVSMLPNAKDTLLTWSDQQQSYTS